MKPRLTTLTWVVAEPPRVGVAVSTESAMLSWTEAEEPGGCGRVIVAASFSEAGASGGDCSVPRES